MRPTDPVSPAIRTRKLTHTSFASRYASRGLRYVVQRTSSEYRDFLAALADRVRGLMRLTALPSAPDQELPGELPESCATAKAMPTIRLAESSIPVVPGPARVTMTHARPSRPTTSRHGILFLAANPSDTTRLALDEECAAIERELRMTTGRDDFDFRSRWAVSVDEVMRALNELQPTVLHFSGHGGGSTGVYVHRVRRRSRVTHRDIDVTLPGIQLQDEQRRPQHVSARALTQMVASAAPSTRLVVLNACFSDRVAEALRRAVDCVVGMRGAVGDEAARSFAVGFYRALGHRRSIGNAVAQAVATLAAKQLPDEHLPICRTRDGVSADEVTLPQLA